MTRPAEEPGTPRRWMVTLDRIRLTGLLREEPWRQGSSYFLLPVMGSIGLGR